MQDFFAEKKAKSNINIQKLQPLLHLNKESHEKFNHFAKTITEHPELQIPLNYFEMDRTSKLEHNIKWSASFHKHFPEIRGPTDYARPELFWPGTIIGGIGYAMNVQAINVMGTDEQIKKWVNKVQSGEYVTCYAQTELAHGSDVQSLKTTATYDSESQTYTLNTPSIEAYKWWPGDMGVFGTHA